MGQKRSSIVLYIYQVIVSAVLNLCDMLLRKHHHSNGKCTKQRFLLLYYFCPYYTDIWVGNKYRLWLYLSLPSSRMEVLVVLTCCCETAEST